jgi:hypothetical protein
MTQVHEVEQATSEAHGFAMLKGLYAWLDENAGQREAQEAERHILAELLAVGRAALQHYFAEKGTGDVGPILVGEDGQEYARHPQIQGKTYLSIFGKMRVARTGYYAPGQAMQFPLDAQANLPQRRFSYPLQDLVEDFGLNGPFRDAMHRLKKWRGEGIWDHSAQLIVREAATDYAAYYAAKPAPEAAPPEEYVVVSVDGKGVPMIKAEAAKIQSKEGSEEGRPKKKEALVGVCYTVAPKTRTAEDVAENLVYPEAARARRAAEPGEREADPKPREVRRLASLAPKKDVIEELVEEAEKRDPHHERGLVLLMDGDRGLERLTRKAFGTWPRDQVHVILDIIHVREYLWAAAQALYAEGSDAAAAWVYKQLLKILQGAVGYVIGSLKSSLAKRKLRGGKAQALRDAIRYFTNHARMMQYDVYLDWGFPIATGLVESTCKSLVKNRMEGCGMRWSLAGAEAMLRLRSVYLSGDWEAYDAFRIDRERQRRYRATLRALRAHTAPPRLKKAG